MHVSTIKYFERVALSVRTGVGAITARTGCPVRLCREEGFPLQYYSDLEVRASGIASTGGRLCDPLSFPRLVCASLELSKAGLRPAA
jgi:hypothetical protein